MQFHCINQSCSHHTFCSVRSSISTDSWLSISIQQWRVAIFRTFPRPTAETIVLSELETSDRKRNRSTSTLWTACRVSLTTLKSFLKLIQDEVKMHQTSSVSSHMKRGQLEKDLQIADYEVCSIRSYYDATVPSTPILPHENPSQN